MSARQRLSIVASGLSLLLVALAATSFGSVGLGRVLSPWESPDEAGVSASGHDTPGAANEPAATSEGAPIPERDSVNAQTGGPPPPSERVEGSFIVTLAPGQNPREVAQQVAGDYGGEVAYVYDNLIGGFAFKGPDGARARLAADPRVHKVDDDYTIYPADHPASRPELNSMNAPAAWQIDHGSNAFVAVIDTGLDSSLRTFLKDTNAIHSCIGDDGSGTLGSHGSNVFGTVYGNLGVLPAGRGYHVKIGNSSTTASAMVCGLNKVASWHAESARTIHAANLSWQSGSDIPGVRAAIADLRSKGVVTMAAAGNGGRRGCGAVQYPARYPEAVAISATDNTNVRLASFSCRGPEVELAAPGENLKVVGGTGSGTSFASPQAAGAYALARSLTGSSVNDVIHGMKIGGFCPPGITAGVNGNGGNCNGAQFSAPLRDGDTDGYTEPALNVLGGITSLNAPPAAQFVSTFDGARVAGTVPIHVRGSDEEDGTDVTIELRINGAPISAGSCPTSGGVKTCSYSWDTTTSPEDQVATIQARVTDTDGQTTTITDTALVDNVDSLPDVEWITPADNAQVGPSFPVRVRATDDRGLHSSNPVKLFINGTSQNLPHISGSEYGTTLNLVVGNHTLRAEVTDNGDQKSDATITVQVVPEFHREPFDGPGMPAGWQVTGTLPLWHVTSACGGPKSGAGFMYYGDSTTCNYETGRTANFGYLTSPVIDGLPTSGSYQLSVESKREVEFDSRRTRDRTFIEVNYLDGTGWRRIWARDATHPSSSPPTWEPLAFELGSATGRVQVRFLFDTTNRRDNDYFGWGLDDFVVKPL